MHMALYICKVRDIPPSDGDGIPGTHDCSFLFQVLQPQDLCY